MNTLDDGPRRAKRRLVLAHGAGAPMDSDWMNALVERLVSHGLRVVRFEFPYMAGRREPGGKKRPPDRQPVLLQRWHDVLSETATPSSQLYIGGKSMGGRMASLIADDVGAAGVICLGYPFHPPGKPDKLRTEHLSTLETPALIVQGERDPFGTREEAENYRLSKAIEFAWAPDGNHDLKPRKASGRSLEDNLDFACHYIDRWTKS